MGLVLGNNNEQNIWHLPSWGSQAISFINVLNINYHLLYAR